MLSAQSLGSIGVRRLREQFISMLSLLLLFGLIHSASATILTEWNFAGNIGNETTVSATSVDPRFQSTSITRGGTQDPGNSMNAIPNSFANLSWPFGLTSDGFFEFSINPQPGTTYSITDIVFDLVTRRDGPSIWSLTAGSDVLDGWTAEPNLSLTPTLSTHTFTLPAPATLTSSRTFRLYGLNSTGRGDGLTAAQRGAGLTKLTINGSVSVPESLPFGVFGLITALLLFVRSRLKV